jgi:hypothetical protein
MSYPHLLVTADLSPPATIVGGKRVRQVAWKVHNNGDPQSSKNKEKRKRQVPEVSQPKPKRRKKDSDPQSDGEDAADDEEEEDPIQRYEEMRKEIEAEETVSSLLLS